jgi:hypothetical protein
MQNWMEKSDDRNFRISKIGRTSAKIGRKTGKKSDGRATVRVNQPKISMPASHLTVTGLFASKYHYHHFSKTLGRCALPQYYTLQNSRC